MALTFENASDFLSPNLSLDGVDKKISEHSFSFEDFRFVSYSLNQVHKITDPALQHSLLLFLVAVSTEQHCEVELKLYYYRPSCFRVEKYKSSFRFRSTNQSMTSSRWGAAVSRATQAKSPTFRLRIS